MADLFVSYSRADKPRAAEIVGWLEEHGWDVFWDQETRAGTLWPKVLEDELNSARCLLALWTTTSIASRWVRIEAYEALQTDKLVPVLLDKVRPPLEFRQRQMFDLVGWDGDRSDPRLAHLLSDLTALLKAPAAREQKSRPIRLVVPATLQKQISATAQDGEVANTATSDARAAGKIARSHRLMFAVGGAAVVAGALAWLIGAVEPVPRPQPSAAPQPTVVASPVVVPAPVVQPEPVKETPPSVTKTTVAVGPTTGPAPGSAIKPAFKQALKTRPLRCTTVEEKFQQTGQISSAERDLLRSKECQS